MSDTNNEWISNWFQTDGHTNGQAWTYRTNLANAKVLKNYTNNTKTNKTSHKNQDKKQITQTVNKQEKQGKKLQIKMTIETNNK